MGKRVSERRREREKEEEEKEKKKEKKEFICPEGHFAIECVIDVCQSVK